MAAIPPWLMLLIGPFVVLNVVIGLVPYITLLERKFAARMQRGRLPEFRLRRDLGAYRERPSGQEHQLDRV